MHYMCLPFHYLARAETETEDNVLSPSPEKFGNNTPIDKILKPRMKVRFYYD